MSDMIEKVARAIDPEGWAYHEVYLKIKEADAEMAKDLRDRSARIQRSLRNARAAIEAMREPTPHMQEAGAAELERQRIALEWDSPSIWIGKFFSAMVDAALSQSPHSLPSEDR